MASHFVFKQDGREYGLEIYREGEWADNQREYDDGYIGTFAGFGYCSLLNETNFNDEHDFFSWLKTHDDYVVAAVSYNHYDGTLNFVGEVDEQAIYDHELFIYATDENPLYSGHDNELKNLETEVKVQEIYNRGMTMGAAVYSIDEGHSFEEEEVLDEWSKDWLFHEEEGFGGILPNLDNYDPYDTDISIEEASEILWNMGWSGDGLRKLD